MKFYEISLGFISSNIVSVAHLEVNTDGGVGNLPGTWRVLKNTRVAKGLRILPQKNFGKINFTEKRIFAFFSHLVLGY